MGARRGYGGPPDGGAPNDDRRAPARAEERDGGRPRHGHEPTRPRGAPRDGGVTAQGAFKRWPTDTHVSQEQRDAAGNGDRAPTGGLALLPAEAGREARRAAEWEGPPVFWDGHLFCGHDARVPRASTCAACFLWQEFRNTRLPCGHQPNDTRPMTCDVCRFYLEDLDERRGRPRRLDCGQLAAVPILWGACACCLCAGHTHGSLDFLFCGHTLERPGLNCTSCQARRALHDAECGVHMLHTRHFHTGATAGNREWFPPNRYDVMTGSFGPMDDSLEAELRAQWLDAVERVTGFDPRQLRRRDFDRDRRRSRAIVHGV